MRFYDISVLDPEGNLVKRADGSAYRWTSYSYTTNTTLRGAPQIELDIPTAGLGTPIGGASVRIWGVALPDISQAADLNDMDIRVFAGMKPGLPLANTQKSGLVLEGRIQQAFGNWIMTDQYLEFVVIPDIGNSADPKNLIFSWAPGQDLGEAITAMIGPAFPGYSVKTEFSAALQTQEQVTGYYQSMSQFGAFLRDMTVAAGKKVLGADYRGVDVTLNQSEFKFYDGTVKAAPVLIAYSDMIGQPSWIGPAQIQVNTVMRPDLELGAVVQLPQTVINIGNPGVTAYRFKSVFQGKLQLSLIRHVGNYRSPDAAAWITTFNGFVTNQ